MRPDLVGRAGTTLEWLSMALDPDLSRHRCPPRPNGVLAGPAVWCGPELARRGEWIHRFGTAELAELRHAVESAQGRGVALGSVEASAFPLPAVGGVLREVRQELLHGRGFVLLRGLADSGMTDEELAWAFWGIGGHLGAAVPQNAAGHLLGHVIDVGRSSTDPSTRIYQTRERQGFHTDSADFVALLCLRAAKEGGRSAIVSASAVHNAMLDRCPELLAELFEPFCTDHRGEFTPGARPYFTAPVLHWFAGELSVLYQRSYIESAQRFGGVRRLTSQQVAALDAFDAQMDSPDLRLELQLEPGDILILHNHQLLHDRTAFVDHPEPRRRRHLLRLWLSPPDGRPLPPCFAERFGSVTPGRRGGVVLPGVIPTASLSL